MYNLVRFAKNQDKDNDETEEIIESSRKKTGHGLDLWQN